MAFGKVRTDNYVMEMCPIGESRWSWQWCQQGEWLAAALCRRERAAHWGWGPHVYMIGRQGQQSGRKKLCQCGGPFWELTLVVAHLAFANALT